MATIAKEPKSIVHKHKDLLIHFLNKYPDNRQEAFRQCGKKVNLSIYTIQSYYYTHIMKSNIVIGTTGSSEGFTINRKNTPVKDGEIFVREESLSPLFIIIENFIKLSLREKASLSQILSKI